MRVLQQAQSYKSWLTLCFRTGAQCVRRLWLHSSKWQPYLVCYICRVIAQSTVIYCTKYAAFQMQNLHCVIVICQCLFWTIISSLETPLKVQMMKCYAFLQYVFNLSRIYSHSDKGKCFKKGKCWSILYSALQTFTYHMFSVFFGCCIFVACSYIVFVFLYSENER